MNTPSADKQPVMNTPSAPPIHKDARRPNHHIPPVAPQQPIKVVLYSHDSQGIGHVRRNLAIAHQLVRDLPKLTGRPVAGLIVSGLSDATVFPLPQGFDWLFIPSITKSHHGYRPRNLAQSMDYTVRLRSKILKAALTSFLPDIVIVDRHILGVQQELRAPLLSLKGKQPNARIVLGLREILDDPEVAAAEWDRLDAHEDLDALVDQVWLFGDRAVHDPTATGEIPDYLCDRLRFTGYLSTGREQFEPATDKTPDEPFILTTVGGGSDGFDLLQRAIRMRVPTGHRHIIVAGPQLKTTEFSTLQRLAGPRTELHRCWPGLSRMIARAAAVISMGGYNTCAEILATTTPALIVPREEPRVEQLIRARSLSDANGADHQRLHEVTTDSLSRWVAQAVARRVDRSHLQRDGLQQIAAFAADLLGGAEVELATAATTDTANPHTAKSTHRTPATAGALQ